MLKKELTRIAKFVRRKDVKDSLVFLTVAVTFLIIGNVYGITAPEDDALAYDLYDVGVNKLLKGPVGFIGGMLGIVLAASQLPKNWVISSLGILGSTALLKADSITTSLGLLF